MHAFLHRSIMIESPFHMIVVICQHIQRSNQLLLNEAIHHACFPAQEHHDWKPISHDNCNLQEDPMIQTSFCFHMLISFMSCISACNLISVKNTLLIHGLDVLGKASFPSHAQIWMFVIERTKAIHHACFPAQEHHDGKAQVRSYMPICKKKTNFRQDNPDYKNNMSGKLICTISYI